MSVAWGATLIEIAGNVVNCGKFGSPELDSGVGTVEASTATDDLDEVAVKSGETVIGDWNKRGVSDGTALLRNGDRLGSDEGGSRPVALDGGVGDSDIEEIPMLVPADAEGLGGVADSVGAGSPTLAPGGKNTTLILGPNEGISRPVA